MDTTVGFDATEFLYPCLFPIPCSQTCLHLYPYSHICPKNCHTPCLNYCFNLCPNFWTYYCSNPFPICVLNLSLSVSKFFFYLLSQSLFLSFFQSFQKYCFECAEIFVLILVLFLFPILIWITNLCNSCPILCSNLCLNPYLIPGPNICLNP